MVVRLYQESTKTTDRNTDVTFWLKAYNLNFIFFKCLKTLTQKRRMPVVQTIIETCWNIAQTKFGLQNTNSKQ